MSQFRLAHGAVAFLLALALVSSATALDAGQNAPELGAPDLQGNNIQIASLRGKVVIVDFWATWCAPCADEMPVLDRLQERFRDRGFAVVAVSVDRERSHVETFLRRNAVHFPVIHDSNHAIAGRYNPRSMPTSYVLDREGKIRFVHRGYRSEDAARFEQEVEALLREPAPAR